MALKRKPSSTSFGPHGTQSARAPVEQLGKPVSRIHHPTALGHGYRRQARPGEGLVYNAAPNFRRLSRDATPSKRPPRLRMSVQVGTSGLLKSAFMVLTATTKFQKQSCRVSQENPERRRPPRECRKRFIAYYPYRLCGGLPFSRAPSLANQRL